jgi:Uma2 family endonuclease
VIGELRHRLRGKPCRVFDSNLKIRVARDVRYCYPDASVVCGEVQFDPGDVGRQTAINPRLVVEVLSPSTELFDRGEKFRRYLELESLQEYVLIAQDQARVETYVRQADGGWRFDAFDGREATADLRSLSIDLPLSEVYAGVEFSPAAPAEGVTS